MSHPLTDDQLRQVAAQLILEDARISDDDLTGIGERLGGVCTDLGITLDGAAEDVDDDVLSAIADLIANANITIEWDDSPLSIFSEANPVETP